MTTIREPVESPVVNATRSVYIVGFAPSWDQTPWDKPDADFWGMNALHKLAPDRPWSAWFQLHDIDKHHPHDKAEHVAWMVKSGIPIYMWEDHIEKYPLPNAVPYPKNEVLGRFGRYFTNTVSWMVAKAILDGYGRVGVYGVDMAQQSEYESQRPSCEWMLGVAQGMGMEVEIPDTSDLLKSPWLYGLEDGDVFTTKLEFRLKELTERQAQLQGQVNGLNQELLQVMGAAEDTRYWLRAWSQPQVDGKGPT